MLCLRALSIKEFCLKHEHENMKEHDFISSDFLY